MESEACEEHRGTRRDLNAHAISELARQNDDSVCGRNLDVLRGFSPQMGSSSANSVASRFWLHSGRRVAVFFSSGSECAGGWTTMSATISGLRGITSAARRPAASRRRQTTLPLRAVKPHDRIEALAVPLGLVDELDISRLPGQVQPGSSGPYKRRMTFQPLPGILWIQLPS